MTGGLTARYGSVKEPPAGARHLAVIDLGSNTFRLVVFRYRPGGSFQLVDEVRETVRLSAGAREDGIQTEALGRARRATHLYAAFCRAAGIADIRALATSAAREAANRDEVLAALSADGQLPVRILDADEEARYGYLGVVNSTTLRDGYFLDVGGGSVQMGRVAGRHLVHTLSRPLGAVRMTERFLDPQRATEAQLAALRRHAREELEQVDWLGRKGGRLVGTGGTIRTLAAMAQRRLDYPLPEVHGFVLTAEAIEELIAAMAALAADERSRLPALKPDRADVTLAGAVVVAAALERAGADRMEVCGQGLREGVFYEHFLAPAEPPLIPDVRRQGVLNLAANCGFDRPHAQHVARLALRVCDGMAEAGAHAPSTADRELLWAAAMLHDVGVMVDYHDHQHHSYYLVLNAGLPGFRHRELAIISLLARGHRKSAPAPEPLAALLWPGDEELLERLGACLRIAEQLERGRARGVHDLRVDLDGDAARLVVRADGDPAIALWSAGLEAPVFRRAFGRRLELLAEPGP